MQLVRDKADVRSLQYSFGFVMDGAELAADANIDLEYGELKRRHASQHKLNIQPNTTISLFKLGDAKL
jgi:hypothetical protein